MTARPRICSSMRTPAAAIRSPPTPRMGMADAPVPSARATPAACRSPDGSPATNRMSRTKRRLRLLDFADDTQRDFEGVASVLAGDHHRRLALDRRDEALVLESQRLSFRGLELDALDELLDRLRRLGQLDQVHVRAKAVELAGPVRQ